MYACVDRAPRDTVSLVSERCVNILGNTMLKAEVLCALNRWVVSEAGRTTVCIDCYVYVSEVIRPHGGLVSHSWYVTMYCGGLVWCIM